jgi:hypothetical protein
MTLEETQALLLKISLVEGREFTPLHAVAWQEILADKTSEEMFAALLKFEQKRPGVCRSSGTSTRVTGWNRATLSRSPWKPRSKPPSTVLG